MKTEILRADDEAAVVSAALHLAAGNLVALPTETVYGLGANGLDSAAVAKIFAAKGRPQDNPLILHIADPEQIELFCRDIPESAYRLAEAFWPGPLTMVLPAKDIVPLSTRAGLPTVAVRCPDCQITRQIIRKANIPVAAPSANISGKPSTTTAEHVYHDHAGKIPLIIDGGPCQVGVESTIIDLTEDTPRLLRPGGITPEQLSAVVGDLIVDKAVHAAVDGDAVVKAPGMKYRHYAPDCKVLIVDGDPLAAAQYIRQHFRPGNRVLCFEEELEIFSDFSPLAYGREADPSTLLAGLFAALRQLDDPSIGTVFARCPAGSGKALAVQNRLEKAAGFCRIQARTQHTVIGITGGSGCGKTTFLNVIRQLGGTVIDCDAVYHRLLETDPALPQAISQHFPGTVVNGKLDRKALAAIVFADEKALHTLNRITHSAVRQEVLRMIPQTPALVAIDAIGLFEGDLAQLCHTTVAVIAPADQQIRRLTKRDGITEQQAKNRIAAQRSADWFKKHCAHTLINDSTEAEFKSKCLAFLLSLGIM